MVFVAIALTVLAAAYCGWRVARWRRTPAELRGDWWERFEAEFRAYATRIARPRPPRRRWNDRRSIGQ